MSLARALTRKVSLLVVPLMALSSASAESNMKVLRVGFSATLFADVDVEDARAATQVWTERFLRRIGEQATPQSVVLSDAASLAKALDDGLVDLVVLLPLDYLEISPRAALVPLCTASKEGNINSRYGLLVRRDGGFANLADLAGRTVLVETSRKGTLPWLWLEMLLRDAGLPERSVFFSQAREARKSSQAILQVFFQQADACVVSLDALATMSELNPQLEANLQVMVQSPGYCRGVVCARRAFFDEFGEFLQDGLLSLRTEAQGQQLLTLFHLDELVPFEPAHLASVAELAAERGQPIPAGVTGQPPRRQRLPAPSARGE